MYYSHFNCCTYKTIAYIIDWVSKIYIRENTIYI